MFGTAVRQIMVDDEPPADGMTAVAGRLDVVDFLDFERRDVRSSVRPVGTLGTSPHQSGAFP